MDGGLKIEMRSCRAAWGAGRAGTGDDNLSGRVPGMCISGETGESQAAVPQLVLCISEKDELGHRLSRIH